MSSVLITDQIHYYLSVYVAFSVTICGVFGNMVNILLFTQLKLFQRNQSAFYLTVAAIIESCQLFLTAFFRATTTAFDFDPTRTSLVWCKCRIYLIQMGSINSGTIVCFTAIDQYLSTSHYGLLRQMSNFKSARRLVLGLVIVTSLFCIPTPIFQEIRRSNCAIYDPSYNYYYSFVYFCIIIGVLPITIASSFSLLSYQNVRRIVRRQIPIIRRRLDRQLTAMVLARVVFFVVTILPFVIHRTYQVNRPVDRSNVEAVSVDQLIRTVTTICYNTNSAGSCYVFLATSSRFRRQVRYFLSKKIWQKLMSLKGNNNEVAPANQLQIIEPHVSAIEVD